MVVEQYSDFPHTAGVGARLALAVSASEWQLGTKIPLEASCNPCTRKVAGKEFSSLAVPAKCFGDAEFASAKGPLNPTYGGSR